MGNRSSYTSRPLDSLGRGERIDATKGPMPPANRVTWLVMRLILVRHGDAYAGFDGVISGPLGCRGLTQLGRRQAEALRDHLADTGRIRADILLASVLPRALETAEIIAPALGVRAVRQACDLCEIHTGEADALAWTEYAARYGSFDMEPSPSACSPQVARAGGPFTNGSVRCASALPRSSSTRRLLAVCHAGVIMASIRVLFDIPHPGTGAQIRPTNTGVTEWEHERTMDRWTLHTFNEHTHLLSLDAELTQSAAGDITGRNG